jgi:hypothetical protein
VPGVENVAAQPAAPASLDQSAADDKDKGAKLAACRRGGGQTAGVCPGKPYRRHRARPFGGHFNPVRQAFAGFAPFQPESRPMRGGALLVNPSVRA